VLSAGASSLASAVPAAERAGRALAGAALLAWLVATALTPVAPFDYGDARSYWAAAEALLEHGEMRERFATGTTPSTWRPPLYAGFAAGLQAVGFTANGAARINQLLLVAAAALLYLCARRFGAPRGASAAAGLAYLWHPAANRLAAALMSESLFVVLALAALALAAATFALWRQPRRASLWALASIPLLITGLHALTFADARFTVPALAPVLLLAAASLGPPADEPSPGGGA
jgi:hypothetical protein